MKKTNFLSLNEILCGESSPELNRIKSMATENAYWTSIFEKVLENVANQDSKKLLASIVRIGVIHDDNTTKLQGELRLHIRLKSPTAAYKIKNPFQVMTGSQFLETRKEIIKITTGAK